jgi:hypothetical protein
MARTAIQICNEIALAELARIDERQSRIRAFENLRDSTNELMHKALGSSPSYIMGLARFPELSPIAQQSLITRPALFKYSAVTAAIFDRDTSRPRYEVYPPADKISNFLHSTSVVRHGDFTDCLRDLEQKDEDAWSREPAQLLVAVWPALEQRLMLDISACMDDVRLHAIFLDVLQAHEAGLAEAAVSSFAVALERAIAVARGPGEKNKSFDWMRHEVGKLPIRHVKDRRLLYVWVTLLKAFTSCGTDTQADDMQFPNRHALSHGHGARPKSIFDSLNAVLLTHGAICIASAFRDHRNSRATTSAPPFGRARGRAESLSKRRLG